MTVSIRIFTLLTSLVLGMLFLSTPARAQEQDLGAHVFADNCSVCHGDKGDKGMYATSGLNPSPRNFTDDLARAPGIEPGKNHITPQASQRNVLDGISERSHAQTRVDTAEPPGLDFCLGFADVVAGDVLRREVFAAVDVTVNECDVGERLHPAQMRYEVRADTAGPDHNHVMSRCVFHLSTSPSHKSSGDQR